MFSLRFGSNCGSGFGVWALGYRVEGLELKAKSDFGQNLGAPFLLRVHGTGLGVWDLSFRVQGTGFEVVSLMFRV